MSGSRPTRDDITEGTTVAIVQEQADGSEPIIGDVRHILTEETTEPGGVRVKLESNAVGRVVEVRPDEDGRERPQGGGD